METNNNKFEDIIENHFDVTLVCKKGETEVQSKLTLTEYFLHMKSLQFIYCGSRKNKRRGGGVGIVINNTQFTAKKLDVLVPETLEVVGLRVRSKKVIQEKIVRAIIIAGF